MQLRYRLMAKKKKKYFKKSSEKKGSLQKDYEVEGLRVITLVGPSVHVCDINS